MTNQINGSIFRLDQKNHCILEIKSIWSFLKYLKVLLFVETFVFFIASWPLCEARLVSWSPKTAFMQGDILLGALVAVHHQPQQQAASLLECGEIREQYGIQRVEAAFMAVDRINEDPNLLPNITLGIEIRDTCWHPAITLEQSIEFIRDAINGPDSGNTSLSAPTNSSEEQPHSPSTKNLVGVIGPGSSRDTIQVQNLLQLFRIPQIGYSATSMDLGDSNRFPYFLRVVPSDYYQAQVMVDLVKHYNWTYVSAVHTDGNYGQKGISAFRELAETHDICIAKEDTVMSNAGNYAFDEVIRRLSEDSRANVVVCFCEGMTVRNLLRAMQRLNKVGRFLLLGSDGWADRSDVVAGLEEAALGGLSVKIHSPYVTEFDEYYFSLRPDTNHRNPWFREFWEHRFNCTLSGTLKDSEIASGGHKNESGVDPNPKFTPDGTPYCTGQEKLSEGYEQDSKMGFVVKAAYTMAHGLHAMHRDLCGGHPGLCREMALINGSLFRDYLMNVTFSYLNENVTFDSRGDPPRRYDIMNFQRLSNGRFDYVKVGAWNNGSLTVYEDLVVFNGSNKTPPASVCSMPCDPGQVKSFTYKGNNAHKCCWICSSCEESEILLNETRCKPCDRDHWPNADKTGCYPIPVNYIDWWQDESIVALILALMGFLATMWVFHVFIKYNQRTVVEATTRELSYIILLGMMALYGSSLPLLHMPTPTSCALSRFLPGLSFSMIYAPLVIKISNIMMNRKRRYMSDTAQVMITCSLITIEFGNILLMLILQPPDAIISYPQPGKVVKVCNTTALGFLAPMSWNAILILLCTIYAVKTRDLPENYNEAKFIGFSMYTTVIIWISWMAIYFGSNHKVIITSVCTSISALVTLIFLFFPKLYIIFCRPDKNIPIVSTITEIFETTPTTTEMSSTTQNNGERNSLSLVRSPSCFCSVFTTADNKCSVLMHSSRESMYKHKQNAHLQKHKSTQGQKGQVGVSLSVPSQLNPENLPKIPLKRETSLAQSTLVQHRDFLLHKAYESQVDLEDEEYRWREEKACQTTGDVLDSLEVSQLRKVATAETEEDLNKS